MAEVKARLRHVHVSLKWILTFTIDLHDEVENVLNTVRDIWERLLFSSSFF